MALRFTPGKHRVVLPIVGLHAHAIHDKCDIGRPVLIRPSPGTHISTPQTKQPILGNTWLQGDEFCRGSDNGELLDIFRRYRVLGCGLVGFDGRPFRNDQNFTGLKSLFVKFEVDSGRFVDSDLHVRLCDLSVAHHRRRQRIFAGIDREDHKITLCISCCPPPGTFYDHIGAGQEIPRIVKDDPVDFSKRTGVGRSHPLKRAEQECDTDYKDSIYVHDVGLLKL